jgi:hypothetical protein
MQVTTLMTKFHKPTANQFIINHRDYVIFQSYQTIIAVYHTLNSTLYFDKERYSNTTANYLHQFKRQAAASHEIAKSQTELRQIAEAI